MAGPTVQAKPETITDIYRDAQEVLRISEKRFEVGKQVESLDTEDPQVIAILETLGKISTPNLARISVGEHLVSVGVDEYNATQSLLDKRRLIAQEGRSFTPAEMAGLAIPMYLARKDEAAEDAAGSESVQVTRYSRALSGAITASGPEEEGSPVAGPITGTVDHADTKSGVFEVVPEPGPAGTGTIYQVEPVKMSGVNAGQVQVHIEAAF